MQRCCFHESRQAGVLELISKMHTHYRRLATLATLALIMVAVALTPTAAADPTSENVTKLKEGIVEVLATWIPFVILFVLIGLALSALGINLFRRTH